MARGYRRALEPAKAWAMRPKRVAGGASVRHKPSPAGLAQLVEQRFCKPKVAGSNPASGTGIYSYTVSSGLQNEPTQERDSHWRSPNAGTAARAFGEAQWLTDDESARLCVIVEELVANLYDHGGVTAKGSNYVEPG